jgi:UDP-glucuronate 4-epimerase
LIPATLWVNWEKQPESGEVVVANYLVTGAAGFIASRVCEMLLAEGHTVVGIDNLCDAYDMRLKHYRLDRLKQLPGFSFIQIDICNRSALENVFQKVPFNAVINLAA